LKAKRAVCSCMLKVKHSGAPDAGNLHVRCDEGKGARPRASFLLYRESFFSSFIEDPRVLGESIFSDSSAPHCGRFRYERLDFADARAAVRAGAKFLTDFLRRCKLVLHHGFPERRLGDAEARAH